MSSDPPIFQEKQEIRIFFFSGEIWFLNAGN